MGLWGVLKYYDPRDGSFSPFRWATFSDRVVSQHQRWTKPEGGDVPEFTIEVAYKSETLTRGGTLADPGWRYVIKWQENGLAKQAREYNFDTKEQAIRVAKREADRIARSLLPVHVETYTPEV